MIIGLITFPIGGRRLGQGEAIADIAGVRHVRAAAQILPGALAGTLHIVINGQSPSPYFYAGTFGLVRAVTFGLDQFQLVGLIGKFAASFLVAYIAPHKTLPAFHDFLHPFFQVF